MDDKTYMPDRTVAPAVTDVGVMPMPCPDVYTLDNGVTMKVLDAGEDDVCRITAVMEGGLAEAPAPYVASLAASALRDGCDGLCADEVADTLDYNGAWFKGACNNHHVSATLYSLNSRLENVLPVFTSLLQAPAFADKEVGVEAEMRARSLEVSLEKVDYHASLAIDRAMMGATHPLVENYVPDDIRGVAAADLRSLYARNFDTAGLTVYLAGRISASTRSAVEKAMESLRSIGQRPRLHIVPMSFSSIGRIDVERPGALQSAVQMAIPAIGRTHADYVPLRLAVMALGGYFGSRLMSSIREDKGYTYGIQSMLVGAHEGGYVKIETQCDNNYVEPLIENVMAEVAAMATRPLDDGELTRLKRFYATSLVSQLDSPFTMMDSAITSQLVGTPASYFADQQRVLSAITADDIARVSARYLDLSRLTVAVAGKC